jgi:hypothetical protein
LIGHQVLHLSGTPDAEQADFTVVTFDGLQAPQRVIQAVAVQYRDDAQRFVISLGFAEVSEEFLPAFGAWRFVTDLIQRRLHLLLRLLVALAKKQSDG